MFDVAEAGHVTYPTGVPTSGWNYCGNNCGALYCSVGHLNEDFKQRHSHSCKPLLPAYTSATNTRDSLIKEAVPADADTKENKVVKKEKEISQRLYSHEGGALAWALSSQRGNYTDINPELCQSAIGCHIPHCEAIVGTKLHKMPMGCGHVFCCICALKTHPPAALSTPAI